MACRRANKTQQRESMLSLRETADQQMMSRLSHPKSAQRSVHRVEEKPDVLGTVIVAEHCDGPAQGRTGA
jgi:uncharacterized protein (DUF1778 family)